MKRKKNYFIQKSGIKKHKGALHKQLGLSVGKKIPSGLLTDIAEANIGTKVRGKKVTPLLKKRAVLAKTLRTFK